MIIQNIIFPSPEFNPVIEAYFRLKNCPNYHAGETALLMDENAQASFNTYFNGFSVEKWNKYTDVSDVMLHLELRGSFTIILFNEYRTANKNVRKELGKYTFSSAVEEEMNIPLPGDIAKGICSFTLVSEESGSAFIKGYYYTCHDEAAFPEVFFAVDICTYKREKYVNRNLELLSRTIFSQDSPLRDKFMLFIADNGQSLVLDREYGDWLQVFPNKNAGGAGGFGRSMIEILRSPSYERFTHIIMMDDDVVLSPETLYRTYTMARTLKQEYRDAFIGGSMLELNNPKTQSEAMDLWNVTGVRPVKYKYNITDLAFVLKNEIEDKGNHFGWWYCMMPIGVVKANNLPLPIFIKRDDVEYGIRNGRTLITLNGLCVLHEAFGAKRQGYLEYYYWRNMCILNAIHYPSYGKKTLKKQLSQLMRENLLRYRYDDANLAFTGVEDFLRGVDWLMETDVEALNQYVLDYTYKALPVDEMTFPFAHGAYEQALKDQSGIQKQVVGSATEGIAKKIFLGWFRKAENKTRYVSAHKPPLYLFYRIKTVINYDEESNRAFITRKSYRQALNLWQNYRRICRLIDKGFDLAKQEYRVRFRELTSLSFWDAYLGLSEPIAKERDFAADSVIKNEHMLKMEAHNKTLLKRDRRALRKTRFKRAPQHCLFWLPIKKNRITFYLHERKGYTCNLKYIAEELYTQYGDQAEIVWVTRYPETCAKLKGKGFRVVRLNTLAHWYYQFTSKAVVTNDAFVETVVVRRGQFTMNTWHAGMNYKRIGASSIQFKNKIAEKIFHIRNRPPKVYLSGSQYFTDDTSRSFGFDENIFLPIGNPRNDIFYRDNTELDGIIRERYALGYTCKLVLYAPTFRQGFREDLYALDFQRMTAALTDRFGGEWKILYRRHYFVNGKGVVLDKNTIDVSDYEDMNELMAVSDVLISDYSSCLWDFSLTGRPSFVYATDMDNYHLNDRDFSYPVEKWPYPIAKDNDELEENILGFEPTEYAARVSAHHADARKFDDGQASRRAVEILVKNMRL